MATNRAIAKRFIDEVTTFANDRRDSYAIDYNDVDLKISVQITDTLRFDLHEDED